MNENIRGSRGSDTVTLIDPKILGLTLSCKSGQMRLYEKTLETIGNPEFFKFLIDENKSRLALCPCKMEDAGSFKNRPVKSGRTHIISATSLIRHLYRANGWQPGWSYQLSGILNESAAIVEFDMKSALRIDRSEEARRRRQLLERMQEDESVRKSKKE